MAVQASMGISRILFMLGTGCTGTILVRKGQLSQILGSLQSYVKRLEGGSDDTDLVSQLSQIIVAVRQIQLRRPGVTMITGSNGNSTTLVVPIASAGALIYGYMWWKGISFSDISYVTKESMVAVVSSFTRNLEQLTTGLNVYRKKKLMNQLTGIKVKMVDQLKETQDLIKDVIEMRDDWIPINDRLNNIILFVSSAAIEYKPQPKFILKSTTDGLLTIMDSPKEIIMDSPKEIEQDTKVKPSISSAFSRKNTCMGISLVI